MQIFPGGCPICKLVKKLKDKIKDLKKPNTNK